MSAKANPIAFIQVAHQQLKAQVGSSILIDYQKEEEEGNTITFDQVLLLIGDKETQIGKPYIKGAQVIGKVEGHRKDKKVVVFKKKRRKGYKVKNGHRQPYTQVMIEQIKLK